MRATEIRDGGWARNVKMCMSISGGRLEIGDPNGEGVCSHDCGVAMVGRGLSEAERSACSADPPCLDRYHSRQSQRSKHKRPRVYV